MAIFNSYVSLPEGKSPCLGNLRNHMLTHGPWPGTFEVPAAISRPWGSIWMADANGKTTRNDIDLYLSST